MAMKEQYTNNLLDRFCEAMAKGLLERSKEPGVDVWPQPVFSGFEGNHFTNEEFLSRLHNYLRQLEAKGLSQEELANLFINPSRTAHLTYQFLNKPSDEKEIPIRIEVAKKLLNCIRIMRIDDPFCVKGRNPLWNDNKVTQMLPKIPFITLDSSSESNRIRTLVARLIVALSGYCEYLYFANLTFGREIHGPYNTKSKSKLLLREYFDLHPSFWNFSKEFPHSTIKFYTVYLHLEAKFDFVGRFFSKQVLAPNLESGYIEIDGEPLQLKAEVLEELLESIRLFLKKAKEEIEVMNRPQLITKWVESTFWILKPLTEKLNQDWRPSVELYRRINTEEPDNWIGGFMKSLKDKSDSQRLEGLKRLSDPRLTKGATFP